MTVYLNPCPFCNEEAVLTKSQGEHSAHQIKDAYFCECSACGKSTDEFLSEQEAASAWNRSGAENLKDVDERIIRSVILKPVKTWLSTISRLFMIPIGPLIAFTLLLSFDFDISWVVIILLGVGALVWLIIFISAYTKYANQRLYLIKHLPKQSRSGNLIAIVMGYITIIFLDIVFFLFILMPLATLCLQIDRSPL